MFKWSGVSYNRDGFTGGLCSFFPPSLSIY